MISNHIALLKTCFLVYKSYIIEFIELLMNKCGKFDLKKNINWSNIFGFIDFGINSLKMVYCFAFDCNNGTRVNKTRPSEEKIFTFHFPPKSNQQLRSKWIKACNRQNMRLIKPKIPACVRNTFHQF